MINYSAHFTYLSAVTVAIDDLIVARDLNNPHIVVSMDHLEAQVKHLEKLEALKIELQVCIMQGVDHHSIGHFQVDVKYENGTFQCDPDQVANYQPGQGGFSNYLCDGCGCILEVGEPIKFNDDGELICDCCR